MYHVKINPLTWWLRFKKFAMSYTGIMTWISVAALVWAFLYKYLFVNIPAKWEFMPVLGEIVFAVLLSVVASTVVLIVTIYIPERQKQKKVQAIVMPWMKQFRLLGDIIRIAIAGKIDVNHEEFKSKCTYDFMSAVTNKSVTMITSQSFENWFVFFDYIFEQEKVYYKKLTPYFELMPIEVIDDIENLLMPDALRDAILTYKSHYGSGLMDIDYEHLTNLEGLIWRDAQIMRELADKYQLYA